jgi:pyruvate formate lyase activating enzyme
MKERSVSSTTEKSSNLKMIISGLEHVTLIDYPGEVACTIFLKDCNFRCQFCYNPELVFGKVSEEIPVDDVLSYLKRKKGKLDAVCITGGEPLLSLEEDFLKKIKEIGYKIKIDTNGTFPTKLKSFIDKGLIDYVAMDIKSSLDKYQEIVQIGFVKENIEESIKIIGSLSAYEFRTTCSDRYHDVEEIKKIGEWINSLIGGKAQKYYLQGFKNSGNFVNQDFKNDADFPEDKLKELKKVAEDYFDKVDIRF